MKAPESSSPSPLLPSPRSEAVVLDEEEPGRRVAATLGPPPILVLVGPAKVRALAFPLPTPLVLAVGGALFAKAGGGIEGPFAPAGNLDAVLPSVAEER